jgi:hypothetical protein
MIDHERGAARSICQQSGRVAVGTVVAETPEDRVAARRESAHIARCSRDTAPHPTCTNNQSCPDV